MKINFGAIVTPNTNLESAAENARKSLEDAGIPARKMLYKDSVDGNRWRIFTGDELQILNSRTLDGSALRELISLASQQKRVLYVGETQDALTPQEIERVRQVDAITFVAQPVQLATD